MNEGSEVTRAVGTSWLRARGPRDARTCPACAQWLDRVLPAEGRADFEARHARAAPARPCRCRFEVVRHRVAREDPASLGG